MIALEWMKRVFTKPFAILVVIVIASISIAIGVRARRRQIMELEALSALRQIANAELAYSHSSPGMVAGTFEDLQREGNLRRDVRLESWLTGYRFARFDANTVNSPWFVCADDTFFTVVVVPRDPKLKLRTFSICVDHTVRVAPDRKASEIRITGEAPCDWEPLR